MSITAHPEPAAAVLQRAGAVVAELDHRLWAGAEDSDLLETHTQITTLRAQLAALEASVLVEVDHRRLPRRQLHWASTTDWLAHTAGMTRSSARRTLADAHDLLTTRTQTHTALRAGEISPAQASTVCAGIRDLPGDPHLRHRAETTLLTHAAHLDGTELIKTTRHLIEIVDPDKTARRAERDLDRAERAAHRERFLSIIDDGAGGIRLKGRGSIEDGATLRAALLPLSAPAPAVDPESGEPLARDPRDHGARTFDALVALAQHALDTAAVPTDHATTARVSVTIRLADLLADQADDQPGAPHQPGPRAAVTDDGLDLSPGAVRRLACDAEIIPIVLGTHSEVLDVGRAHRTVTPVIWRALVTRDRHCAFPGCHRPPIMCHAHHIIHWAYGGPKSLANLVLLCGEHHRRLHDTPWQVRISPHDHHPEFLPPPPRDTGTSPPGDPEWTRHRPRRE